MRVLQSQEILIVSGAHSLETYINSFIASAFFVGGTMAASCVTGHIVGNVAGYQLAKYLGAGVMTSYLSGFGLGVAGAATGLQAALTIAPEYAYDYLGV